MTEGYYWIQHNGVVQVAYYTNDTVDDLESGQLIVGIWHLTRGDDICHNGEAEVLSGRYITSLNELNLIRTAIRQFFYFLSFLRGLTAIKRGMNVRTAIQCDSVGWWMNGGQCIRPGNRNRLWCGIRCFCRRGVLCRHGNQHSDKYRLPYEEIG